MNFQIFFYRSLPVRAAAAQCLQNLAYNWNSLYTTELDSLCQSIFRGFDGANAQTRKNLSQLLGSLIAYTQQPPTSALPSAGNSKSGMKAVRSNKGGTMSLEEALNVLLLGYVKGGSGGSGELYNFPNTAKFVKLISRKKIHNVKLISRKN